MEKIPISVGFFPLLGVGVLNQPSPSKAGELGLFPWRTSLGLELSSVVVSHGVLLFALIMEWKRKIKKVKVGFVLVNFAFIKLHFWRLLPGVPLDFISQGKSFCSSNLGITCLSVTLGFL